MVGIHLRCYCIRELSNTLLYKKSKHTVIALTNTPFTRHTTIFSNSIFIFLQRSQLQKPLSFRNYWCTECMYN